jgi:Tfp pilus assembly protein PilF
MMKSLSPKPTPLQVALENYNTLLHDLTIADKNFTKEQGLELLAARDFLQKQLEAHSPVSAKIWTALTEQDARLKKQAYKITQVLDLAEYRESLLTSDQAWWWYLDSRESSHPLNRWDWLVKTLKLILLGVNFTLIGAIATRFLGGGSGLIEIGGVIFSTFISLLQTQNALTQARQQGFMKLMNRLKIPEYCYEEIQFFTTFIIFLLLICIFLNFPFFSQYYKQEAYRLQNQASPNFALAEKQYLKAIALDEDNLDAHYKLATLYEELQDLDSAKKQYLIAAKGGYLDAYNNLAYWYIRENKDGEAIALLEKGKALLAEKDQQLDKLNETEKLNLAVQRYNIYKNLGWARFKQNHLEDAKINLLIAMGIAENSATQKYIRNPGAVFCLYAQVLQKQDKKSISAKENWQKCLKLSQGKVLNIEEDQWLFEARKQSKK